MEFLSKIESIQSSQEKLDLSLGLSQIGNHLIQEVQRVIPTEAQALIIADRNTHEFVIQNVSPEKTRILFEKELKYQIEDGVFSWVINHRKVILVSSGYFTRRNHKINILMMPLFDRKKILGMLFINTKLTVESITQGMFNILVILGYQFSLALENATLYQNLEKNNTLLETLVQERTRTLEQLNFKLKQANEKLKVTDRLKNEFLANTSHELRTPLNSIIGFLNLIIDGVYDSRDEMQEFLVSARESSHRLLALINNLLDIAKIEAGEMDLHLETVSLHDVFKEIYLHTRVQAERKKLNLSFSCQGNGEIYVKTYHQKLNQILLNIIENSIKFTPKGRIEVSGWVEPNTGYAKIQVQDTGVGVPPEKQKNIFSKFVQADGSTSRKFGGTGLGLAITKSLVELLGGVIELSSLGKDQGTTVTFTVPISDESLPD